MPFRVMRYGIIAVGGRGVEKPADHAGRKARETKAASASQFWKMSRQLPFVIEAARAISVAGGDGKPIPRPAGVAMPAAKGERKIFTAKTFQLRVAGVS